MSQYREAIMALQPVAYWRLGEPSGYIAIDEMWGHHGTYNGAVALHTPGLIDGDNDTAVELGGTTEWMEVPDAAAFNVFEGVTPWTIAGWISHTPDAIERIIFYVVAGAQVINIRSNNVILAVHRRGDDIFVSPLAAGPHFIVVTYSGTQLTTYVDTAIEAGLFGTTNPTTSAGSVPALTSGLGIGAVPGAGGQAFNGVMDEFAVFDFAMSQAQINALYEAGTEGATGLDAMALAIADRFLAAAMTPPTGLDPIRSSTANIPNQLPPLPAVLVFPDSGNFETGNGTRLGSHDFIVRFYFNQVIDITRDMNALRDWVSVLWYQLRDSVQLGGIVDRATIDTYQIGMLTYAGETYSGIELGVTVIQTEPWMAIS